MCQDVSNFSSVLHHFVLAKLATSSIRAKLLKHLCLIFLPTLSVLHTDFILFFQTYRSWKEEKDSIIKQKERKKKKQEMEKTREEQDMKTTQLKDAEKVYEGW